MKSTRHLNLTQGDLALLERLKINGRESVSSLARHLKRSRTTIQDRIDRLEQTGVIRGYTAILDEGMEEPNILAMVSASIDSKKQSGVLAWLERNPWVKSAYTVSGRYDVFIEVGASSPREFDLFLDNFAAQAGVLRTESMLVLSKKFKRI